MSATNEDPLLMSSADNSSGSIVNVSRSDKPYTTVIAVIALLLLVLFIVLYLRK